LNFYKAKVRTIIFCQLSFPLDIQTSHSAGRRISICLPSPSPDRPASPRLRRLSIARRELIPHAMNATKRTRNVTRKPKRRDEDFEMPGGPLLTTGDEVSVPCWTDEVGEG